MPVRRKREAGPHMWVSDAERQPVVGDISPLFVGIWCRHTCRRRASDMCERVCASLYGVRLSGGWGWVGGGVATTCIFNNVFCRSVAASLRPFTLQNLQFVFYLFFCLLEQLPVFLTVSNNFFDL